MISAERELRELFALNVLLQVFDGVVTYQAIGLGLEEGNPILRASFAILGIGPALVLFKAHACGLLFLLRRSVPEFLRVTALRTVAITYALLSVVPWLGTLFVTALRL